MKDKIKALLSTTFNVAVEGITDHAGAGDIKGWDSAGHLELMMAMEMQFQVTIPTDVMLELLTIDAIDDFLNEQKVAC
jgi:acyl carrier protein